MQTVFSHIVQKRFSQVNEDVATDALSFVLGTCESARKGMTNLIRGIIPNMPDLRFRTQQTVDNMRPDMWGYHGSEPRVFVENKFWAGLTDNQPVPYIQELAKHTQPTVLLFVVPDAREQTLWRELCRRLNAASISAVDLEITMRGIVRSAATQNGPIIAITSWTRLLSILELEVADDTSSRSDLLQLRALCDSADNNAFLPISSEEVSDQRTPAFILQLGSIVQASIALGVGEGTLNINKLMPQASWERFGRYVKLLDENGIGVWIGIHFVLWKKYGGTPLWILFFQSNFGRAHEVRPLLEAWSVKKGILIVQEDESDFAFAIGIEIALGEDKDYVVRCIVDRLTEIAGVLVELNSKALAIE